MIIDIINLRKGMIAELDTVNVYTQLMEECKDAKVKELFADIIKEELVHVGEFQRGIDSLCPIQRECIEEGIEEAEPMFSEIVPMLK